MKKIKIKRLRVKRFKKRKRQRDKYNGMMTNVVLVGLLFEAHKDILSKYNTVEEREKELKTEVHRNKETKRVNIERG